MSFSVPDGVALPPSLLNIYKEIRDDLGVEVSSSGDLTRWAEQGVLLLNATLTVRAHQANSHQRLGWTTFTDAAIRALSDGRDIWSSCCGVVLPEGRNTSSTPRAISCSKASIPLPCLPTEVAGLVSISSPVAMPIWWSMAWNPSAGSVRRNVSIGREAGFPRHGSLLMMLVITHSTANGWLVDGVERRNNNGIAYPSSWRRTGVARYIHREVLLRPRRMQGCLLYRGRCGGARHDG